MRKIVHRERIFYILIIAIGLFGLSYAALVHSMVQNMIVRQDLIKENRTQIASIGALEGQYFSLKGAVTMTVAKNLGFEIPATLAYISEKGPVARTNLNEIQ